MACYITSFQPPRSETTVISAATNVVRLLVGPVLAIVRLVAATLLLALYFLLIHGFGGLLVRYTHRRIIRVLSHWLISVSQSIAPPLQRPWNNFWIRVLARITLLLMGFYYIRSENVSVRRGLVENTALKDLNPAGLSQPTSLNDLP